MTLQLGMSREDREPADVLTTWALKEYERLQQEAPSISGDSIVHIGLNYETVSPGTQNTQMTGMLWLDDQKSFIVSGNNQLENYRTKDSYEINDI